MKRGDMWDGIFVGCTKLLCEQFFCGEINLWKVI